MLKVIPNYIYFYHLKSWCMLPGYPESLTDSSQSHYTQTEILGRSAPIYTYSGSGPRNISFNFKLHRDMMNDIDIINSNFNIEYVKDTRGKILYPKEDVLDVLIKSMQAAALPKYSTLAKAVTPPLVAIRLGDEVFIKGVINGQISVQYSGPITEDNKYSVVDLTFAVDEINPYDAESVKLIGSFRGLDKTIITDIFK